MRQSSLLVHTLKRYLKLKGITYKELARKLGQSESNIKRSFSREALSLRGLEAICEATGLELLELAKMSRPVQETAETFTRHQEEALAKDPKLFTFFYLILSGSSVPDITRRYEFSKEDCGKYLLRLDKMGLLRLHPGDRVQLLASRNIKWLPDGSLNALYREEIKTEFLNSHFSGPGERLRLLNAHLSKQSLQTLSRRIDRLIAEFVELAENDSAGPSEEVEPIWFVLAYRPWRFSVVSRYRKHKH